MNPGPKIKYDGPLTAKLLRQWKKLSTKEQGELAYIWDQELKESNKVVRIAQFRRGENAVKLAVTGAFKLLMDDDSASLHAYLAQPEFKINARQFFRLMRVWQKWVNEFGYDYEDLYEIPLDILEQVAQLATEDDKEKWLHALKTLSVSDIKKYIKENSRAS